MLSWLNIRKAFPGLRGDRIHVVNVETEAITKELSSLSFKVYMIDGSKISDENSFFDEVAQALEFPEHFGHNWAAWNDCLGDFGSLAPKRVAIVWKHADETFAVDAQTFLQAVCDLENLAMWSALHPTDQTGKEIEPKQIEIFFLGDGEGFAKLQTGVA
jgi:RNAse (barnase) inhibitor barstar